MQLIEREPALDALGGWFAEARAGRGRLVLIGGEAGVGKTTLVNEFSVRHRHAGRILRGACDALTTPRPHGLEEHVARAYTNLASVALNQREYVLASRYRDEGIQYCTERDLDTWGLAMLADQARADFEQGRWTEATRTVDVVLRDPRTSPASRIDALAVLGRVRARRGDPGVWPPLDEALGLGTGTGELQRLGPVVAARAEAAWLEGDPAAVARKLRELGVRGLARGPRPATRDNPANLTARETEVLALVTEGLRNADIAQRLFVSPKTVDHHVSAILAKLGVQTRGEAARAATRLGING